MADDIQAGSQDGATPAAPAAAPQPPTPSPTPAPSQADTGEADKRFKGIQADLAKERRVRQQFETERNQYQAELAAERKRVQALAGVTPQNASEAEAEEIRARFAQLYPHLGGLTAEEIQEMRESLQDRKSLKETTDFVWRKHATTMVGEVYKELSSAYGGELTKKQQETINRAYVLRAQADPEFLQRHEDGDPTLAKEFAKEWIDEWFEPARRKITAAEVNQFRRVPNGKDRSIVNQGEKKINVNNNDEVMDLLVAGRTFTGRNR